MKLPTPTEKEDKIQLISQNYSFNDTDKDEKIHETYNKENVVIK